MAPSNHHVLKIQSHGRVVIPHAVRAELGVQEGDELLLVKTERGYLLTTREALLNSVMGSLARDDGRDMTQELLDERRAEALARAYFEAG